MPRGDPWTSEEEEKLLQSLGDGKSVAEIAVEHERTPGGIISRMGHIAVRHVSPRQDESIREMLIRIEEKLDRLLQYSITE